MLRLLEYLFSCDWDEVDARYGALLGLALNVLIFLARANVLEAKTGSFQVFIAPKVCVVIVYLLGILSIWNAVSCFGHRRHYRFFERSSSTTPPPTSSAHRVHIDTSSTKSSLGSASTARVEQPGSQEVWELSIWDPKPLSLRLFCLFNPGHIMLYLMFVPFSDSVKLLDYKSPSFWNLFGLLAMLSVLLTTFRKYYDQHSRDSLLLHREFLYEYDTKLMPARAKAQMHEAAPQSILSSIENNNDDNSTLHIGYSEPDAFHYYSSPNSIRHQNSLPSSSVIGVNALSDTNLEPFTNPLNSSVLLFRRYSQTRTRPEQLARNDVFARTSATSMPGGNDSPSFSENSQGIVPRENRRPFSTYELTGQQQFAEGPEWYEQWEHDRRHRILADPPNVHIDDDM